MAILLDGEMLESGEQPDQQVLEAEAQLDEEQHEEVNLAHDLENDAKEVIKTYFEKHSPAILGKNWDGDTASLFALMAEKDLVVQPITRSGQKGYKYSFSFRGRMDEHIRKWWSEKKEPYLRELDIFGDDEYLNKQFVRELIPEYNVIKDSITITWSNHYKGFPYLLAMSMPTEQRGLPVMALHSRRPVPPFSLDDGQSSKFTNDCLPTLQELCLAAKRYGVRELKPTLDAMETTCTKYRTEWGIII